MSSRLDRLFILLESGSNPGTRRAAASQLGEVVALRPGELLRLLSRLRCLLTKKEWDTRLAAAQALESILAKVKVWQPGQEKGDDADSNKDSSVKRLSLENFDLEKVMKTGKCLMASEGGEFDEEDAVGLGLQKQRLQQTLGLDVAQRLGFQQEGFIEDADLVPVVERAEEKRQTASEVLAGEIAAITGQEVSSREKNRLKRKAKMVAKAAAKVKEDEQASEAKKTKLETVLVSQPESDTMVVDSVEVEVDLDNSATWPLQGFCSKLALGLFSECWEARHGAATGLRELLRVHGSAGGRVAGASVEEGEALHQSWLEDIILRLLCVLGLDRFGDFVSDAVVAPVRESAAQALGVALPLLPEKSVLKVADLVLGLVRQEDWEARHGGLLAAKYLLAVRTDLASQLLQALYPQIFTGLTDSADDVVAVAAAALLPVVPSLVSKLPGELARLAEHLWEQLAELDDLTSSTQSVMALLAELLAHEGGLALCLSSTDSLPSLVPRLYPFLSHSSSMVRHASLSTVLTLSSAPALAPAWLPACAPLLLRHLYSRALLEHQGSTLALLEKTWTAVLQQAPLQPLLMAACPWFGPWLQLLATPGQNALDHSLFPPGIAGSRHFLGGSEAQSLPDPHARAAAVARARHTGARLMGRLAAYIVQPVPGDPGGGETPLEMLLSKVLVPQLQTDWAHQHTAVAMLVRAWLEGEGSSLAGLSNTALPSALLSCLTREAPYAELTAIHARLSEEAGDFVASLRHYGLPVESLGLPPPPLSFPVVQELVNIQTDQLLSRARLPPRNLATLQERHNSVASTLESLLQEQDSTQLATLATLAGALAALGPEAFPAKLNPVLKPLMEAVKRETGEELQRMAACSLARVLEACINRQPCPNDKVVKNLCSFVCSNPEVVPLVDLAHLHGAVDPQSGILTLHYTERRAEQSSKTKRGRKRKNGLHGVEAGPAPLQATTDIDNEEEVARAEIQRRGTTEALRQIAKYFGPDLPVKVPMVYQMSFHAVANIAFDGDMHQHQELVNALEVVRVITPCLHPTLLPSLEQLIPRLLDITRLPLAASRYMAARVLAALAKVSTVAVMTAVITCLLPGITDPHSVARRAGVMETLHCLCEELGLELVPYIVLLIVPVLGAMSDANMQVRLLATNTFATLVRLLPLDGGTREPEGLNDELRQRKEKEKVFLSQLMDSRKAEEFRISVPVKAELRSYQVAGVNWLAFLARYRLHGVLCDDMGLGKTLQTICVVASDHRDRAAEGEANIQSLVVCPATLGGHWLDEVKKFVGIEHLQPFLYFGPPHARVGLRSQLGRHNLIITSYDIVRNDIELLGSIKWNFLVLDEGHVIKNTKTKTAIAIRQLVARHRLILTGTPIQNNVNELWALFDFLMPGYLGSERSFGVKYGRPILASREAKCGAREQEAGALAMEALHRQTLPFILRRMKEEVLADLPPKITQDYYCNLSPLQTQLYEDFTRAQGLAAQEGHESSASTHVFQALQYLRKVCCHPKLVLSPEHPEYKAVLADHLNGDIKGLLDINHAAKLVALKQLLIDLGMGQENDVVGQHRALIFCQLKSMMDIVESDLLKAHLPAISYLRLDGSVPAASRHTIVSKFNSDPSIDLLLLSTSVGGLGLNLTGADTAMDRAHRIGQKKVVNVYRMITRATIEEKIMSLQKFKLHTARTVISSDNSDIKSMQTEGVLDLFSLDAVSQTPSANAAGNTGVKAVLDNLPELWAESDYTEEYDMQAFIKSMKPG